MKILKMSSPTNYFNSESKVNNSRFGNNTKLSPLTKDTVSFGAGGNIKKKIEELKSGNSSCMYNIKRSHMINICEYFGYKKSGGSKHDKYTGPYGQVIIMTTQDPIDAGAAYDFINAIKRADSLNGELIIFNGEPTQEQLQMWKDKIQSTSPFEGFENKYAQEMQIQTSDKSIDVTQNRMNKELQNSINELKTEFDLFESVLISYSEKLNVRMTTFEKDQKEWQQEKIIIPKQDIESIKKLFVLETEKLADIRKQVSYFKSKLNENKMLSDEEISTFKKIKNGDFSMSELVLLLEKIEEEALSQFEKKDELSSQIISVLDSSSSYITETLENIEKIHKQTEESMVKEVAKRSVLDEIDVIYQEIKAKLKKVDSQLIKYFNVDLSSCSVLDLEKKLEKITAYAKTLDEVKESYQKLDALYSENVAILLTAQSSSSQIEKFQKRFSNPQVQQQNSKGQVPSEEPVEVQVVNIPQVKVNSSNGIEEPQKIEGVQKPRTYIEEQKQKFKEKIVANVLPISLPSSEKIISQLVDELFDDNAFSSLDKDKKSIQTFVNDLLKQLSAQNDYQVIKKAVRFAFLHSVYENLSNKSAEIYSLSLKQTKALFDEVASGKTNILLPTDNNPVRITLKNKIDISQVDKLFNEFNVRMSDDSKRKETGVLDALLEFSPLTDNELNMSDVLSLLLKEGSYYELLCDKNACDELKTILLEAFWKKYDEKNGTDLVSLVIKKFKSEKVQQMKLDAVDKIDWTL